MACGGMHSLALTEGGVVWTWGEPWGDFSMMVERTPRQVGLAWLDILVFIIYLHSGFAGVDAAVWGC